MYTQKLLAVSLAGAALLLPGCAGNSTTIIPLVQPVFAVRNGGVDADGMYRIGRYYQGQSRHTLAEQAFLAGLKMNPEHAETRNALGVSYFVLGKYVQAEEQFRLAIAAAPGEAHLRNNLDRLHAMTGRTPEPVAAVATAAEMPSVAATDVTATAAAPAEAVPFPVTDPAARTTPLQAPPPDAQPETQMVSIAPNVWELTSSTAQPGKVLPQTQRPPVAAGPMAQHVEVSNGNGVTGMAKRVGLYLQANGYGKPRLTNQPGFRVKHTEVRYIAGAERQAHEVIDVLQAPALLVPAQTLERNANVQVVLGRDFRESPKTAAAGSALQLATGQGVQTSAR